MRRSFWLAAWLVPAVVFAQSWSDKGETLFRKKNWKGAIILFEKAAVESPQNSDVQLYLGRSHQALKNFPKAINHFKKAAILNTEDHRPHLHLGEVLFATQEYGAAERAFGRSLKIRATPGAYAQMGEAQLKLKDHRDAKKSFQKALKMDGGMLAPRLGLAEIEFLSGKYDKTVSLCEKLKIQAPRNLKVRDLLANGYLRQGRLEHAAAEFSEWIQIDPKSAQAHLGLARAKERQGEHAVAAKHFKAGIQLSRTRSAEDLYAYAACLNRLQRHDAAMEHINQALAIDKRSAKFHVLKSDIALKTKAYSTAQAHAQKALVLNGRNAQAQGLLGLAYHRQGKWAKAISPLERSLKKNKSQGDKWYALGASHEALKHSKDAIKAYSRVSKASVEYHDAQRQMGDIFLRQGDYDDAKDALLAAQPKHANYSLFFSLGEANMGLGQAQNAQKAFQRAVAIRPKSPMAHKRLGDARAKQKDHKGAIGHYQASLALDDGEVNTWLALAESSQEASLTKPEFRARTALMKMEGKKPIHAYRRGVLNEKMGKDAQALADYRHALKVDGAYAQAHRSLARLERKKGNLKASQAAYRKYRVLKGDDLESVVALGEMALKEKRYAEASTLLKQATDRDKNNAKLFKELGHAYKGEKRFENAARAYARSRALNPKDLKVGFMAAEAWMAHGNREAAIDAHGKVLGENPGFMPSLRSRAELYIAEKQFRNALRDLQALHGLTKPTAKTLYQQGLCHHVLGEHPEAVRSLRVSIEKAPKNRDAYVYKAKSELAMKKQANATATLEALRKWHSKDEEALLLLAKTYEKRNRITQANQTYQQLVKYFPKNAAHWQKLGETYASLKKTSASIGAYEKAIGLDSKHAKWHHALGIEYVAAKRWKDAERSFAKAVILDKSDPDIQSDYARTLFRNDKVSKALSAIKVSTKASPKVASHWLLRAKIETKLGQHKEAGQSYSMAASQKGSDPATLEKAGRAWAKGKDLGEANEHFDRAYAKNPKQGNVAFLRAQTKEEMGDKEDAIAAYRDAIAVDASNADSWGNMGMLLLETGKDKEGRSALERSLSLKSSDVERRWALVASYRKAGANQKAYKHLQVLAKQTPKDWKVHRSMGQLSYARKALTQANGHFRQAVVLEKKSAELFFELGRTEHDLKKYSTAIKTLNRALGIKRNHVGALYHKGLSEMALKKNDEAVRSLEKAALVDGKDADVRQALGKAHLATRNTSSAIRELGKAISLNPNISRSTVFTYADLLMDSDQAERAVGTMRDYVKMHPKDARGHHLLGQALEQKKDFKGAESALKTSVKLDPRNARAFALLGLVQVKQKDLAAADQNLRIAKDINGKLADVYYGLGQVAYHRGKVDVGIQHQKRALSLDPNLKDAHYQLGLLYTEKGWEDKANQEFGKAIKVDPMSNVSKKTNLNDALKNVQ